MAEKARQPVNFYESGEAVEEGGEANSLGFKSSLPSEKVVVSTRLDGAVVGEARAYCHNHHVTFSSMVEIGLRLALDAAESAEKLRRAGGRS